MFKMLMQQEGAETCQIQEKHPKVRENTLKLPKVRKKGPNLSKDAEIVSFRTIPPIEKHVIASSHSISTCVAVT